MNKENISNDKMCKERSSHFPGSFAMKRQQFHYQIIQKNKILKKKASFTMDKHE